MQDTSQLKICLTNRFKNRVWLGWIVFTVQLSGFLRRARQEYPLSEVENGAGWRSPVKKQTNRRGRGVKDRARGCSSVVGWLCCTVRGGGEDVWAPCSSRVRKDRSTTSRSSSHLPSGAVHKLCTWRWIRHSEIKYLLIGLHVLLIKRGYTLHIFNVWVGKTSCETSR